MKNKLTVFEAVSIISIITIAQIVLDFPEYLIDLTGTGTVANLAFLLFFISFFCIIITKIFKNFANQDIIDISELVGGKFLKTLISLILIVFLFLAIIIATSNFTFIVKNTYFKNYHFLFVFSIFILAIIVACFKGFSSTKKVATFFFGILVISIFCLTLGDNGNFNTNNLVPFFGFDYKTTFGTGLTNSFIFNFIIVYFFLMPLIAKKNNYPKIVFWSLLLNFILITVSVIAILQYYPTSVTKTISDVSSSNIILAVTRRIQISSFLSQTDSIFILFWTYAILCHISILIHGIFYIFEKNFHYEDKRNLTFSIIPIVLGGTILINNVAKLHYLEKYIFNNFSIVLTFGILFLILIIGHFKNKKGTKNVKAKK